MVGNRISQPFLRCSGKLRAEDFDNRVCRVSLHHRGKSPIQRGSESGQSAVQYGTVFIRRVGTAYSMNAHEPPARAFAELSTEMGTPRFAASAVALNGYECSGCGCRFPETRAPEGRTPAETRRLEKIHIQREFARHVCAERGW